MNKSATKTATEKYFEWIDLCQTQKGLSTDGINRQKRRIFDGLTVSALGCGTYLGAADDATDRLYEQTLLKAGLNGINFFDTAINYRCMRSEKVLGKAIRELTYQGIDRDQIVIATKGGYLPCEGLPDQFDDYVRIHFLDTGLITQADIVAGCHCMAPAYLEQQIAMSLQNLGLECIDLYYLHNPETQLQEIEEEEFYRRLLLSFQLFEKKVSEKKIKRYGLATWNGFRQKAGLKGTLQFSRVLACAKEAGGENHHFRAIQMPFNLIMLEAIKLKNQIQGEEKKTMAQVLSGSSIALMASAPLMQAGVAQLSSRVYDRLPKEGSSISQALQFVVSTPAICTAFIGMKNLDHFEENRKLLHSDNWMPAEWANACISIGVGAPA